MIYASDAVKSRQLWVKLIHDMNKIGHSKETLDHMFKRLLASDGIVDFLFDGVVIIPIVNRVTTIPIVRRKA